MMRFAQPPLQLERFSMSEPYKRLNEMLLQATAMDAGFRGLVRSEPITLAAAQYTGFHDRYHVIKNFQQTVLDLCNRSLKREIDPVIAKVLLNEILPAFGEDYHRSVLEWRLDTPIFFRTDESVPGKITEIQCPGSGWGECSVLADYYTEQGFECGCLSNLPQRFVQDVNSLFPNGEARIHYLLDNCALPNTTTYFIQQTRKHHLQYFAFDRRLRARDANLIRSHTFLGLIGECNFSERLAKYREGELIFDFPPTMIFDQKMSLLLPFWSHTRAYFDDRVREIFPHTSLVTPDGVTLASGESMTLEQFATRSPWDRDCYLKYAGYDIPLHLEGRGVYYFGEMTAHHCREILSGVAADYRRGKYWILQESYQEQAEARYFEADGRRQSGSFDTKYSAYYGPSGLMSIDVMHGRGAILRQSLSTVIGVCLMPEMCVV